MNSFRFTFILLFCSAIPVSMLAQQKNQELGDGYYSKSQYANAIHFYSLALKAPKSNKNYLHQRIGDIYYKLNKAQEARKHYEQAIKYASLTDTSRFNYAQVLKETEEYTLAKAQFLILANKPGLMESQKQNYQHYATTCDSISSWSTAVPWTVTSVKKINSEFSDVSAVGYKNGLVFSSNREEVVIRKKSGFDHKPYYNFYFTKTDSVKHSYSYPKPFSSILNTPHHELSPSFTKDFSKIYFSRCKDVQDKDTMDKVNRSKLFSYEWVDGHWAKPHKFVFNDSTCSYGHPALEQSENAFFFASDMSGGYGGSDIYVCIRIDDQWTNPINLGSKVNTPGNELYPFYHSDGTLYFSSDYHAGYGGYDIFSSKESNGEWTSITNLKKPINSASDDFSIFLYANKNSGYITSNRPGGQGEEDIYKIEYK